MDTTKLEAAILNATHNYNFHNIQEEQFAGYRMVTVTNAEMDEIMGTDGWMDMEGIWSKLGDYDTTIHNTVYTTSWYAFTGGRGLPCILWRTGAKKYR